MFGTYCGNSNTLAGPATVKGNVDEGPFGRQSVLFPLRFPYSFAQAKANIALAMFILLPESQMAISSAQASEHS